LRKGVSVNSEYSSSSGLQRFLAVVVASILTGSLFAAVVLGLAGDESWNLFAQDDTSAPLVASRPT
jgi:hypothetical protein